MYFVRNSELDFPTQNLVMVRFSSQNVIVFTHEGIIVVIPVMKESG
jgi:hypothetical protein